MTMTDREMLGLAAKAAGYVVRWYDDSLAYGPTFGIEVEPGNPSGFEPWNPLEDDGDAFRLALCRPGLDLTWVITEAWQASDDEAERAAYVRRAITETLARIGKAMQEKH
ncbi:hypothetical protein CHR29_10175 [Pseudomonas monteilii]|nr:hypothetical protein CHR29_10175 [Pseudomonas monteilii]AYO00853.1 hypothetical protein D8767_18610 [Pseudomonas sp. LTGT-11-2Z]